MAQETSNDLPVIVGAILVGIIAIGIFYFMRAEPQPPAAPEQPVLTEPATQAVAPMMIDTTAKPFGQEAGATGAGGGGAVPTGPSTAGAAAPGGGGGGGPTAVGVEAAG